jgi:hypothetical protein
VARGRARDGAFSRLERAERSERATGHCVGVPLPGADRSVRDFFPLPVNEKNYRVDARKRELKKTRFLGRLDRTRVQVEVRDRKSVRVK